MSKDFYCQIMLGVGAGLSICYAMWMSLLVYTTGIYKKWMK
jgi:hypothetical protein